MPDKNLLRFIGASSLAILLNGISLTAQPQEIVPVHSGSSMQSLNGDWRFKYVAGSEIGSDIAFSEATFAGDAAWKTIPVPGHWELHGFAEPKYAKVDDGTGLYRRTFRVPDAWRDQRVFLRFEGVLYGFEAWVNGRSVGTWASSYNPASFDITDALHAGGENTLAVRVTTRSKGWEFDTNDCWALSGIYRDVTLFAVPATHFQDYTARTTLAADGTAQVSLEVVASGAADVTGRLVSPTGNSVATFNFPLGSDRRGATTFSVRTPLLWTAETPALYRLEIALQTGGKTVQQLAEKIGLRQVTITDGVLKLNGAPVKLHGVDHHDIWPVEGRVATEELLRRDLSLIRAANINFIRTSHYPPHPRLIELCDELGLYVMDEVPFGFGDNHLTDPSYQDILFTRARATVLRDKNHPSVIVWSVGNENPNTPLTLATGQRVKELDPTRPICFPQVGSYFDRSHAELPPWVDIYAPHYPVVKTLQRYATELTRPIIVTEYAHALGLASDRIQDEWEIMQANPRYAGGAVWMFQDQGILRVAEKPTDLATPSLYAWPDATHYYDTSGNGGMDGIVYSDRTPQVDYWEVRKVYSPVQIAESSLPVNVGSQKLTLHVSSRFDFRTLAGFKLAWALQKNGVDIKKGNVPLSATAHATEAISLEVKIPDDLDRNFYLLALRCLDERGESVTERTIRLESAGKSPVAANLFASLRPAALDLAESPDEFRVTHPRFTVTLNRKTGALVIADPAGRKVAEGAHLHVGRRFTEAEALRVKATPGAVWTGAFLHEPKILAAEATRTDAGIRLSVRGEYPRAPEGGFFQGEQTLLIAPNGQIDVAYDYTPVNATGTLLEAGLSFTLPVTVTEFRWVGEGPFSGYPGKDRLNEFGFYHLSREDLNFQGNRRRVSLALLTTPAGAGMLVSADAANIGVQNYNDETELSHNASLSGRGNKGVGPETSIKVENLKHLAGKFTLLPLGNEWPEALTRWFGKPGKTVPVLHPFFRSYDQ